MSDNGGKPVEASDALGQAQEHLQINIATEERPPPLPSSLYYSVNYLHLLTLSSAKTVGFSALPFYSLESRISPKIEMSLLLINGITTAFCEVSRKQQKHRILYNAFTSN
jgi:hypothetical protein